MRMGVVRTDLNRIYLSDVENTSQRNFSSEPPGQSRYFSRPTDAQIEAALTASGAAHLSILGTVAGATKVTNGPSNVLRIRTAASASFSVITVTSSAALANATLITDLNTGFASAGLTNLVARLGNAGTPLQVLIENTSNSRDAYLEIDTTANGSNLNTAVGFAAGGVILIGLKAATVRAAVQPSTTINVSTATITALSATPAVANATLANLTTNQQTAVVNAVADVVAPKLIETGRALLSFDRGIISKLRSTGFQPGGTRSGLPAGVAVSVVANDGSTAFTV